MKKFRIKAVVWLAAILVLVVGFAFFAKHITQKMLDDSYPLKYEAEIDAASKKYDVDKALIYGVIKTESNFNPNAKSSAGAIGLMQIVPDTFTWLQTYYKEGEDVAFEALYDPALNIDYGTELLLILLKKYENEETAICAYNGGVGHVDSWLSDPQYSEDGKTLKIVPFPETDNYRRLVAQNKSIYNKLYFQKKSEG